MGNSKAALELPKDHCLDVSIKNGAKMGATGSAIMCICQRCRVAITCLGTLVRNPFSILACCNSRRCGQKPGEVEFEEDLVSHMVSNKDGKVAWLLQLELAQSVFGKGTL